MNNARPDVHATSPPQLTSEELLKEEMEVTQQLVKDFPVETAPLALLGTTYETLGNSLEAVKCWEACLKLNPMFAMAFHHLGMNAIKKTEYEEAIRLGRKAVEIDPAMPGVHGSMGRALLYLGKPREAVVELEEEVRLSPRASLEYFLLGQAYLQLNAYEKAKANYEKAAQLQPDDSRAYYGLAAACDKLGENEKAAEYREKFDKLKSGEWNALNRDLIRHNDLATLRDRVLLAHLSAGRMYRQAGGLSSAEEHFRRAVALAPANAACLRELATLYQIAHREQDGLEICARIREIEPGDAINILNIGMANARLQRFDAAEAAFQKVIELAPQQGEAYRALAGMYLQSGRKLREAKSLAETAVRLQPTTAANFLLLGRACDKTGDVQGALSAVERAMGLEPNNDQYRRIYEHLKQRK